MIVHKNEAITQPQLIKCHPLLLEIVDVAAYLANLWYGDDLRVTAIYDPYHPGLTHRALEKFHRFLDASILKNGGREGSERLRQTINAAYPYDPERKPGLVTIPDLDHEGTLHGSTAAHFHFQIAPKWLGLDFHGGKKNV